MARRWCCRRETRSMVDRRILAELREEGAPRARSKRGSTAVHILPGRRSAWRCEGAPLKGWFLVDCAAPALAPGRWHAGRTREDGRRRRAGRTRENGRRRRSRLVGWRGRWLRRKVRRVGAGSGSPRRRRWGGGSGLAHGLRVGEVGHERARGRRR